MAAAAATPILDALPPVEVARPTPATLAHLEVLEAAGAAPASATTVPVPGPAPATADPTPDNAASSAGPAPAAPASESAAAPRIAPEAAAATPSEAVAAFYRGSQPCQIIGCFITITPAQLACGHSQGSVGALTIARLAVMLETRAGPDAKMLYSSRNGGMFSAPKAGFPGLYSADMKLVYADAETLARWHAEYAEAERIKNVRFAIMVDRVREISTLSKMPGDLINRIEAHCTKTAVDLDAALLGAWRELVRDGPTPAAAAAALRAAVDVIGAVIIAPAAPAAAPAAAP